MKTQVYSIDGKKKSEIDLPQFFNERVREDLVYKFIETHASQQPYGPSVVAGKQHSASGIIRRKRHSWKVSYGLGISRVPRKIVSNRGTRFNWIGAEVAGTVGGRRAHPPKSWTSFNGGKINKKEEALALKSALAATAQKKFVSEKYASIEENKISHLPFIIDLDNKVKTNEFMKGMKEILKELYSIAIPKKSIRAGKGKMRGRRHKQNAGMLVVVGKKENLKLNGIDVSKAYNVSVMELAKGGPGRLTVYTENAIKELQERVK